MKVPAGCGPGNIARCDATGGYPLGPGVRVIVRRDEPCSWWRGVIEDGPRMIGKRVFESWRVRPADGGRARWIQDIAFTSSIGPSPRLPA